MEQAKLGDQDFQIYIVFLTAGYGIKPGGIDPQNYSYSMRSLENRKQ